ncbi:hypothetical protein C8Q74DRAFT_987175 [Fomes fomentarius]|nr:hypothetical protein C8Q74DRAFT_987175 [Fomes fomentarius]
MSSADDATISRSIGQDIIQSFVAVVVETFVIAIYSVLVLKAGRLLLRKNHTRVSSRTCLAVFVMFGLALSLWMIDIHNVIAEVQMTLLSTSKDPLEERYVAAMSDILRLASVEDILYAYMTVIGDGIIIWRVYAFWSTGWEKFVLLIPITFLLGSISTSMMLTYCAARLGSDIVLGTYQDPAFCRDIQTASYAVTLATTAVATLLISYKTWQYRQTYLNAFGKSPRTRTQRIMLLFVESGILYLLFFVVQVVMSLDSVNTKVRQSALLTFAFTVYQFISSLIVGMYPTVIVLLVNSKHSVLQPSITQSSGTEHSYTNADGISHSTYIHTTSSATAAPAHTALTTVDLYEMAHLAGPDGEERSDVKDRSLAIKIQQQQCITYDV